MKYNQKMLYKVRISEFAFAENFYQKTGIRTSIFKSKKINLRMSKTNLFVNYALLGSRINYFFGNLYSREPIYRQPFLKSLFATFSLC